MKSMKSLKGLFLGATLLSTGCGDKNIENRVEEKPSLSRRELKPQIYDLSPPVFEQDETFGGYDETIPGSMRGEYWHTRLEDGAFVDSRPPVQGK